MPGLLRTLSTRAPHLLALPLTAPGRRWPALGSLRKVLAGLADPALLEALRELGGI
ncbi:hypothetical protein [Caldinitratiruptor microaerophilus]|uniref:Uncharacterized protein n=1 Tax=Caldinitratiruptor microaerophilus TaxID=671077 RepID=A0AA35CL84_9FIRM|nr:hypothetical protein [Caldinitratiruptor microaerophilus]BDG59562.1 hypothetical protein caldi_06520 [Caldinitratiruptor microaerophilus]